MANMKFLQALAAEAVSSPSRWFYHLGGLGLIPLGLLDASLVPVPGSLDLLTVILSAHRRDLWLYYAAMATLGAVTGALVTYRLARKGGQEALAKRMKPQALKKVQALFDRWGFGAIAIPALLPPPVPMVPFVLAAGTAQYPLGKFVVSLTLGRAIRYTILAFLGAHYGRQIVGAVKYLSHPVGLLVIGVMIAAVIFVLLVRKSRAKKKN
ncbi:MAG TPA: VTT domain-containing protein [Candidatus Angelobacter sp.]|jgi:membrane protein DedA with SNARE-associated domain|nr:VTT domain-containing protein [Candidatus Angelobacter sp.]